LGHVQYKRAIAAKKKGGEKINKSEVGRQIETDEKKTLCEQVDIEYPTEGKRKRY